MIGIPVQLWMKSAIAYCSCWLLTAPRKAICPSLVISPMSDDRQGGA